MREIKFRGWNGRVMAEVNMINLDIDTAYSGFSFYCSDFDERFSFEERDVLMQYTGLKDKNGKEIYEGDILSKGNSSYKVEFFEGSFGIFMNHYGFKDLRYSFHFEVIGNIHENEELLNK